jgi:geranylgeranyl reductase family protein
MADYDVVVVGAGPAGSAAARAAAREGAKTLLLEEHPRVGLPVHCSGLLSATGVREADLPRYRTRLAYHSVSVRGPGGASLEARSAAPKAFTVDRHTFDPALADTAADAGAELWTSAQALSLSTSNGAETPRAVLDVRRDGERRTLTAGAAVVCDGLKSALARQVGLPPPRFALPAAQVEVPYEPMNGDGVELYLGRDVAPGFFGWAIPLEDGTARVGLAATGEPKARLERFLTHHPEVSRRLAGPVRSGFTYGIPLGFPPATVKGPVAVAGNAAGQVKPTSGGGIYLGMACGAMAGRAAARAARAGGSPRSCGSAWRSTTSSGGCPTRGSTSS